MELGNFKFDKPWYLQSELLIVLSMSSACLKRYMQEQKTKGTDLSEMGYMKFKGFKEACWNPHKLMAWILENKIEQAPKYDYDLADQKREQMRVINLNNKQQQKGAINA